MSTKERIQREADVASEKLSEAADEVKERASEASESAKQAAYDYAEGTKQSAAQSLNDFAHAVRTAGNDLSEREQGFAARLVTEAADGLESAAQSVSGTSMGELMSGVQRFARRNPGAFAIGTVLAGVALGRFLKASSDRPHADEIEPRPSQAAARPTTAR